MTDIYHITHLRNIPSILAEGGLCCDDSVIERDLRSTRIGYRDLKERRARTVVPIGPKGTLSDYVPFYFAPRSPMLYVISKGRVPGYTEGQSPVLHLVASAEAVEHLALDFVFTDGHAYVAFSEFFNDLSQLDTIDWDIMKEKYWHDTPDDGDRTRRRNAEFLVHRFFPWSLVREIGVLNKETAQRVTALLQSSEHQPAVRVYPHWYY